MQTYPGFHDRLYDDSGSLRQFINIYVNDSDIRFAQGLEPHRRARRGIDRPRRCRRWRSPLTVPLDLLPRSAVIAVAMSGGVDSSVVAARVAATGLRAFA